MADISTDMGRSLFSIFQSIVKLRTCDMVTCQVSTAAYQVISFWLSMKATHLVCD